MTDEYLSSLSRYEREQRYRKQHPQPENQKRGERVNTNIIPVRDPN